MSKIICHPGCLCVACIHCNPKLNKSFNDAVICHQENNKCVKIEKENNND